MSQFKDKIRTKPRYSGDLKIKRILDILGVSECIANNNRVIEVISMILEEISGMNDIEEASRGDDNENGSTAKELRIQKLGAQLEGMFTEYSLVKKEIPEGERENILQYFGYLSPGEQCYEEELGYIVAVLEKCKPLSNEDLKKWIELKQAPKGSRLHKYGVYYGIEVNKDGSVDIQELTAFKSGAYTEKRTRFGISKSGEIVERSIQNKIGSDSRETKSQTSVIEATGVVKERQVERKLIVASEGKQYKEEATIIRDNKNPAIAIVKKERKRYFTPIDLNLIHDLPDVICNPSVRLYNTCKEASDNMQNPDGIRMLPRYKDVVEKMLEKAGVVLNR